MAHLGLNPDGTVQVPPITGGPLTNEAAWYKYSPTPGQPGAAIIEGHIDSYAGPSVFYRLGALHPGNTITITRADHSTATFTVDGVRAYLKTAFPTNLVYANTPTPTLRLITCGGAFDHTTNDYLSNTVVYASLTHTTPPHRH